MWEEEGTGAACEDEGTAETEAESAKKRETDGTGSMGAGAALLVASVASAVVDRGDGAAALTLADRRGVVVAAGAEAEETGVRESDLSSESFKGRIGAGSRDCCST
jgi:hypothetical protein